MASPPLRRHNLLYGFASMALPWAITSLLFFLLFACVGPSTCHVVKGAVSCLDCAHHAHISGVRVLVKCDKVKKLGMATTDKDGSFEAELPSSSSNCLAMLLGAPKQICSLKKNLVSKIVKDHDPNFYTISTPLSFSTSCPLKTKTPSSSQKNRKSRTTAPEIESSMTINVPLPREWGLAPSSYYLPVLPIIGIP